MLKIIDKQIDEVDVKLVSQVIMNEVNLLQYDVDIKSSLQLTQADTAKCIAVLEKYKTLEVTALMLKKNPQVAETIKRLRRYVGNTKEWNLSDDQTAEFNEKASRIRKLAEFIYKNFKVKMTIQLIKSDAQKSLSMQKMNKCFCFCFCFCLFIFFFFVETLFVSIKCVILARIHRWSAKFQRTNQIAVSRWADHTDRRCAIK